MKTHSPEVIWQLQRTIGNTSVARFLSSSAISQSGTAIQRATVSGITNENKSATQIGDDVHRFIQREFLEDVELSRHFDLHVEVPIGGGRADLVAISKQKGADGENIIYVGEIKSRNENYYGGGAAVSQLRSYIAAFRAADPDARVGILNFWNPDSIGYFLEEDGYDRNIFVENHKDGIYRYYGSVKSGTTAKNIESMHDMENAYPDIPSN